MGEWTVYPDHHGIGLLGVATLGAEIFSRAIYPLLSTFQMTAVSQFVDNVDPLIVINYMIVGIFKVLIFTYAACAGIATQWKLSNYRAVILPVCLLVWLLATYMAPNLSSHIFTGLKWVPWVMWVPLFLVIPLLLFLGLGVKRVLGSNKPNEKEG